MRPRCGCGAEGPNWYFSKGTCTIGTIGRGKAALRWLERLKGKKLMQVVDSSR